MRSLSNRIKCVAAKTVDTFEAEERRFLTATKKLKNIKILL